MAPKNRPYGCIFDNIAILSLRIGLEIDCDFRIARCVDPWTSRMIMSEKSATRGIVL
ncbi:hypothetical protein [Phyllobacterium phragmitis]|uniref:hypothetical protein n=1 Tax=Phyllobacterium phragmitis TaxID=2670329 RepID=UPI0038B35A11